MSDKLYIKGESKEEIYQTLYPQLQSIIKDETDMIANMANLSACLSEAFNFWWVGFYRVIGDELVLGPFQGPMACTRIKKGRGVCGTSWNLKETVIVPDVDKFPGHIACSSESRSEIVVPIFRYGIVTSVLDIDSNLLDNFDNTDKIWLERIVSLLNTF